MMDVLRQWLNGKRDYYEGIVLYQLYIGTDNVFSVLSQGETPFTRKRLDAELLALFKKEPIEAADVPAAKVAIINPDSKPETVANTDLYAICKKDADKRYKEVMNKRAVLFSLSKFGDNTDPNTPDRVKARTQHAIDVVMGYNEVSALYDKADFVAKHGHLPADDVGDLSLEYDNLPDSLVKSTLDNKRKAVSKLRQKEQTPERVALIQQHELNIKKLEAKWHLLQQP